MKIAFIFSHCPDPRINKRISALKRYYQVHLIYWNRDSDFNYKLEHEEIDNTEVVIPANYGRALNRIIPTFKFGKEVLTELRRIAPDIIYVGNIDMLYIVKIYYRELKSKPKIVYEIADLHTLIIDNHKSFLKRIARFLLTKSERKLCKSIDMLVVTSEKFYEIYYSKFIPEYKVFFVPNMPDLKPFEYYSRKKKGPFTIGFIGAVRYKEQMKMLISAAEILDVKVLFAGVGLDDEIENLCRNNPRIEYHGKYDYNSEIAELYSRVDCVYSVYDADLNNVKLALPNKLYESIYCELPIIVARETYLADQVESMGVGVAVAHNDPQDLMMKLTELLTNKEYYNEIVRNCKTHKNEIDIEIYNQLLKERVEEIFEIGF